MLKRTSHSNYSKIYKRSRELSLLDNCDTSVIYFDKEILENRLEHLKEVFSTNTLHAIAIKTCPLLSVLKEVVGYGFGLEAASYEEIELALKTGIDTKKLVFDSPVKTDFEIEKFSKQCKGAFLNVNTLEELERIPIDSDINIGIRINPIVKTETEDIFNVSTEDSKFGVPILDKSQIINACIKYPKVNGIHIHIGSNLKSLNTNILAIEKVVDLIDEIEKQRKQEGISNKIEFFDIGGGYSAIYSRGVQTGLNKYVQDIKTRIPNFFERFKTITEYGRFVYAHTAWLLSKVEYMKSSSQDPVQNVNTALIHVGGDMLLREIYQKNPIKHNISILDSMGKIKQHGTDQINIAGPLCYGGDYIGKNLELPAINEGDFVIIEDIGANSFSLWSRHCSRAFPKVIAYNQSKNEYSILKKRENIQSIINFWS